MTDLERAIAATTGSARSFARLIGVDERTVRRWQSGERHVPEPVRRLCVVLVEIPEATAVLLQESVR
jgi:DNA-binding transcriptional regulator YiaG